MEDHSFLTTEAYYPETQSSDLRTPPHDKAAEEAVLGAILINSEKYYDVSQLISKNDFYIRRNQWIWQAYMVLIESGQDVDVQTVASELEKQGKLEESGGKVFLYSLASNTPTSMHAESYASIIAEKSIRRQLINASDQISQLATDEKRKLDNALDLAEKAIFNVSEYRTRKDVQQISDVLGEIYNQVRELLQKEEEIIGVPTGFRDLTGCWAVCSDLT